MNGSWTRRHVLKIAAATAVGGLLGKEVKAASFFGRMFAVPARDTSYFTPNEKFYIVNYSDSPFSLSRDLNAEQWQLSIGGAVKKSVVLRYADILKRQPLDQAVTLECIDNLPGGDSMGTAMWRGISLKSLLEDLGADRDTARDLEQCHDLHLNPLADRDTARDLVFRA